MVDYSYSMVHDGSDECRKKTTAEDVFKDIQAALCEHHKPAMMSTVGGSVEEGLRPGPTVLVRLGHVCPRADDAAPPDDPFGGEPCHLAHRPDGKICVACWMSSCGCFHDVENLQNLIGSDAAHFKGWGFALVIEMTHHGVVTCC